MHTPSRRTSTAAFIVLILAGVSLFFFISSRADHQASSKSVAALKNGSARNAEPASAALKPDWLKAYGKLPLSFEANENQSAMGVRFISRGTRYDLALMNQEADLNLRQPVSGVAAPQRRTKFQRAKQPQATESAVLRMRLDGSNPNATITGVDRTATKINYFIGNDPKKWHTDVPAYAKVKYEGVYPGVDLVFYGNQREFEYDFLVAPGADAKAIALNIEGATKMRVNARGDLVIGVAGGMVELKKPDAYQALNGIRKEVAGNYIIANHHEVRFALADYDRAQPLTIDPVVTYATYVGGSGNAMGGGDAASGIALDGAGDAYIVGSTSSADLIQVKGINGAAVPGSVTSGNTAAFVAELNPAGTAALYLTYLGGSTADGADAIAVDGAGNIYLTGFTESADFPLSTTNAPLPGGAPGSINTGGSAFVTRLNPSLVGTAQLVYSTYLGGSGSANGGDEGFGIAVDGTSDAFITGTTFSADFPTEHVVAPFTATLTSPLSNVFLTEINTGASGAAALLFSGYLGGTGAGNGTNFPFGDAAFGIAIDASSNAYIVGTTTSGASFPTAGTAISSCAKNAASAVFVAEAGLGTPTAPTLVYSTCLAGSTADVGNAIALGPKNIVYLTGGTFSTDFPVTANTIPLGFPGPKPPGVPNANSSVAFVSTVDTTMGALTYSTLLGGSNGDQGFGIATDSQGVAYVAGQTNSANFPITKGALQITIKNPAGTAFVAKVNAAAGGNGGQDLLYSTYFGGTGDPTNPNGPDPDAADAIAVSGTNAYITGQATTGLATTAGVYQAATKNAAGTNAFVADLPLIPILSATPNPLAFGTQLLNTATAAMFVTVTNNSASPVAVQPVFTDGANGADFSLGASATPCPAGTLAAGASCMIGVIFTPTVVGAEAATLEIANGTPQATSVALTGTGTATGDFSVTAPATASLMSGMAGSIPVTITGLQGFSGMVNLSCTGLSANVSSCTVPASANTGTMVNASVTATVSFIAPPESIKTPPTASMRQVVFLVLGIALLFMIPMTQRFRPRLGMVAAMLVFVAIAGCGGGGGPKTGTGSITITGTGTGATAGITHSATVALTITK